VRAFYDEEYEESAAPSVHFENVGVRYGMGPEVLRDLTFSIEPNSFQFLTGPSGAGKTTLLRLILLSVKPTRGLVSLFGEKQRAAIARALIVRPDLLLADEPTGNVDPSLARRLLRLFIELNRLGTSVVIATHDFSLMDQLDVRRLVLGDGRLHIDE
jgi:ABC-type ATPase involved in cell division